MDDQRDKLIEILKKTGPVDEQAIARAMKRQADLAKPPGSLGGLEEMAVRLSGITGKVPGEDADAVDDNPFEKSCVIVFCADNGVVSQGVASAPQSVTRAQTINFTRRLTGVGAIAESYGSELLIVDMGVKDPIPEDLYDEVPMRDTHKIIDRSIRPGTWDISKGPAMTEDEVLKAILAGFEMAESAVDAGYGIIGIGEMGIGNTTTSAAVLSALTGEDSHITCGRGGGVNDAGFAIKKDIIDESSKEYRAAGGVLKSDLPSAGSSSTQEDIQCRLSSVTEVLARCGGFDICAMAGAYIYAAYRRVPAVIDGYISAVAALVAAAICPEATGYMFASHKSAEPGYVLAVDRLRLKPFLDLDMRLGEGSGCPITMSVIKGAWDVMGNMGTFEEAEINDDYLEEIRREEGFR